MCEKGRNTNARKKEAETRGWTVTVGYRISGVSTVLCNHYGTYSGDSRYYSAWTVSWILDKVKRYSLVLLSLQVTPSLAMVLDTLHPKGVSPLHPVYRILGHDISKSPISLSLYYSLIFRFSC